MYSFIFENKLYEGVSTSFRTGRLKRELRMVRLSATRCSCIAILWVSLAIFAAITLCVAFQRVFIFVISLSTQSGNFWIHPRMYCVCVCVCVGGCARVVNVIMNLPVPQEVGNFLPSWTTVSFSKRTLLHGYIANVTKNYITLISILLYIFCKTAAVSVVLIVVVVAAAAAAAAAVVVVVVVVVCMYVCMYTYDLCSFSTVWSLAVRSITLTLSSVFRFELVYCLKKKRAHLYSQSRKEMPVVPDLLQSSADKEEFVDQEIVQVRLAYISLNTRTEGCKEAFSCWV
jgi:hypothetical protein